MDKHRIKPRRLKVRPEAAKAIVEALKQNPPPPRKLPQSVSGDKGEEGAGLRQKPTDRT